ncbi:GTP:AMP phosphotransferase AK3, mitochondrial-like [Daphnia pulex]|uniref:GTP:AMP phosphotransferase AK3, mitochondrial-like n=1 Tax=Daphnia pulex TaxID=6669 RepID=UPI001EDFBDCB|nr:GTP:AMP phosphotransferase AK3, mitochondrial-like [Daphnia pulex]XP_046450678.1 GTP:AMP phosphotransferase AK3, mitochondrial-like [Daphnia pulex]
MSALRSSPIFRAIILGAPASGKGTISSRIVRDFKLKHLSGGDLLRSQIGAKTEVGLMAKTFMDKGSLVPDDVMSALIINELALLKQHSWLLDGFPRTLKQAETLNQKEHVDVVISLDVPEEEIVQRVAGRWTHIASGRVYNTEFNPPKVPGIDDVTGEKLIQRDDDKPEAVRQRLQTYEANIKPILEFYDGHGILKLFKGRFTNEIWPKVHGFLSESIPKSN